MSGTTLSSDGLSARQKRILFRAWHRGTREMDLLLGRFADACLPTMADSELTQLESLIELPDRDLFSGITGSAPVAPNDDGPVYRALRAFHLTRQFKD